MNFGGHSLGIAQGNPSLPARQLSLHPEDGNGPQAFSVNYRPAQTATSCAPAIVGAQVSPSKSGVSYSDAMGMGAIRTHHYQVTNRWTGNLGAGTSTYSAYSRDHELSGPGKASAIQGSSDPLFRGNPSRYNPEELLVGALSACHMLWVLHLCADAGIVVLEYSDSALGDVVEHGNGSGEFTRVLLRPCMTITDSARIPDAVAIHHRAHEVCCLARSVNFPVELQPRVDSVTRSEKS